MAVNNLNTPGTGIQPTLVDAKGDLIAGVANDAVNRLAVGTNGQQLVADSTASTGLKWDNPSGLVHINTQTFSAVSAVNLDNVFSAQYDNYRILTRSIRSSSVDLRLRMRDAGSTISGGSRIGGTVNSFSSASSTPFFENGVDGFRLSSATTSDIKISFDLFQPFTTEFKVILGQNARGAAGEMYVGMINQTASRDGFQIAPDSGTFTGEISVYGYRK